MDGLNIRLYKKPWLGSRRLIEVFDGLEGRHDVRAVHLDFRLAWRLVRPDPGLRPSAGLGPFFEVSGVTGRCEGRWGWGASLLRRPQRIGHGNRVRFVQPAASLCGQNDE